MAGQWKTALRDNKKAAVFLGSQAVTLLGSSLVQYAMQWYIVRITDSGLILALYTLCSFLPQIFVSLFAGVWADRYNRKKLIMVADGGIAIATLLLCIIMSTGYEGLVPIFIIAAIRSFGGGIQSPAVSAMVPQLVQEKDLMRFNSINSMIQSIVLLASPAIGGAVLSMGPLTNILLIDIITAAIGIGILAFIPIAIHKTAAESTKNNFKEDIKVGINYVKGNFFIKRLTGYYLLTSVLITPAAMFSVLFVTRMYGDSYLNLTLNEMAFFIGSILGGIVLASTGGFKNRLYTLGVGCLVFGLATMLMGLVPPFVLYLIIMGISGFTMPTFQAPVNSLIQEKVSGEVLGRVFSLMQIVSTIVMMLTTVILGPLSDKIPLQYIIFISGALLILMSGAVYFDKKFIKEGLPKPLANNTQDMPSENQSE